MRHGQDKPLLNTNFMSTTNEKVVLTTDDGQRGSERFNVENPMCNTAADPEGVELSEKVSSPEPTTRHSRPWSTKSSSSGSTFLNLGKDGRESLKTAKPKEIQAALNSRNISFEGPTRAEFEDVLANMTDRWTASRGGKRAKRGLLAVLALMALMATVMTVANYGLIERSKETHVSPRSNMMVGLDGKAVTVAKDTSYIKLAELSRASLEYLSNLEDVTLASQGKVYQYKIAGYTLHDTDNLDLRTMGDTTVIQIQCGAIHIKFADGKMIDADELSTEATAAARQLRAMSAFELQAHYEEHASVATRKLAAANPLKALSAFFGGMAKSSANSELYGALAPTTGCKKPAAIISFARPTIPASSKWSVMDAETKNVSTWYMKLGDADDELPVMRFEQKIGECEKSVVVGTKDNSATWTEFDETMCTEELSCPSVEEIMLLTNGTGATCDEYKSNMTAFRYLQNAGEQVGCSHSTGMEGAGELKVTILDVKTDGSAVWEIGLWAVEVSATGVPTGIKSKYEKNTAFDTVLNVESATDATVFDPCTVATEGDDSQELALRSLLNETLSSPDLAGGTRRRLLGRREAVGTGTGDTRRRLLWGKKRKKRVKVKRETKGIGWTGVSWNSHWSHTVSQTTYCGAGTKAHKANCAENQASASCRWHDHGIKVEKLKLGVRLECAVDKNLLRYRGFSTGSGAIGVMFGRSGIANTYGCFDKGPYSARRWKKVCKLYGRVCWWEWRKSNYNGIHIQRGTDRYEKATSQPNNLIWGYYKVGYSMNGGTGQVSGGKATTTCKKSLCEGMGGCPDSCLKPWTHTCPSNRFFRYEPRIYPGGLTCTEYKARNPNAVFTPPEDRGWYSTGTWGSCSRTKP